MSRSPRPTAPLPGRERIARIKARLGELVGCYSPSHGEGALLDRLVTTLQGAGYRPTVQPIEGAAGNLLISLCDDGSGALPGDIWLTHYDTVSEHLGAGPRLVCVDDEATGLGVVDTKGAIAALIDVLVEDAAAIRAAAPRLGVVLVCDEEDMQTGVGGLIDAATGPFDRGDRAATATAATTNAAAPRSATAAPTSALVFEPTRSRMQSRFRGFAELELEVESRQLHAAFAAEVDGAAWLLAATAAAFRARLAAVYGDAVALNLRELASGPSGFVTPARASLSLDAHADPTIAPAEIERLFRETVQAARRASPHAAFQIPYARSFRGQVDAPDHGPLAALAAAFGSARAAATEAFPSHSDANVLAEAGCLSTVFGPGDLRVAHGPGERVSLVELARFAETLHHAWPLYARAPAATTTRRP